MICGPLCKLLANMGSFNHMLVVLFIVYKSANQRKSRERITSLLAVRELWGYINTHGKMSLLDSAGLYLSSAIMLIATRGLVIQLTRNDAVKDLKGLILTKLPDSLEFIFLGLILSLRDRNMISLDSWQLIVSWYLTWQIVESASEKRDAFCLAIMNSISALFWSITALSNRFELITWAIMGATIAIALRSVARVIETKEVSQSTDTHLSLSPPSKLRALH